MKNWVTSLMRVLVHCAHASRGASWELSSPYHGADQHYILNLTGTALAQSAFDHRERGGGWKLRHDDRAIALTCSSVCFNDPRPGRLWPARSHSFHLALPGPDPLDRRSSPLTWTITRKTGTRPCTAFACGGAAASADVRSANFVAQFKQAVVDYGR